MKKFIALCLVLLLALSLVGCGKKESEEPETPNALVPSIMYNGEIYGTTGRQIPAEVDASAYAGKVTSTVPLSEWPSEEGQANFGEVGIPYAMTSEGFAVLMNNEWTVFEIME